MFFILLTVVALVASHNVCSLVDHDIRARVAVIGGGIAGASFAHFAKQEMPNLNITIFEAEDVLGGRIHHIEIDDEGVLVPIEVGASIFVDANRHLVEFAQLFNLSMANKRDPATTRPQRSSGAFVSDPVAIVGDDVVYRSSSWKVVSLVRAAVAFGLISSRAADAASSAVLAKWMSVYACGSAPFDSVEELLRRLTLENETRVAFDEYLRAHGVAQSYIDAVASIAG